MKWVTAIKKAAEILIPIIKNGIPVAPGDLLMIASYLRMEEVVKIERQTKTRRDNGEGSEGVD